MSKATRPTFTFDGTVFDLSRTWIDVIGGRWEWTGEANAAGEPLMTSDTDTMPLPDVYHTYGPLIPAPVPPTAAAVRTVLTGVPSLIAELPKPPSEDELIASPGAWAAAWHRCRTVLRIPTGGAR